MIGTDGRVDRDATERRRAGLRADRVKRLGGRMTRRDGTKLVEASVTVHVHRDAAGTYHACAKCGCALGDARESFKRHALREDLPITAASPRIADPAVYIDNRVSFRHFYCPGCGTLLDTEVAADDVPPLHDIEIRIPAAAT